MNKNLDTLIFNSEGMAIDAKSARQYLADYVQDLDMLASGVPYSELGISKRREANKTGFFTISEGGEYEAALFADDAAVFGGKRGRYAHMKLSGMMRMEDGISSNGIQSMTEEIRRYNADPNINGILVEVNSGGGQSIAGNALFTAVKDSKKPVVALVHTMGSAALNGMLGADYIVANGEKAEAGSIGTFTTIPRKYAEWYNENFQDIYAKGSPNKNKEFRDMLRGSMDTLQQSVDENARIFQNQVAKNRSLNEDLKEETLSGGMFLARSAKQRGLVDEVGSFDTAVRALDRITKERNAPKTQTTVKNEDMNLDSVIEFLSGVKAKESQEKPGENTPPTKKQEAQPENDKLDAILESLKGIQESVTTFRNDLDTLAAANEAAATVIEEISNKFAALEANQKNLETSVVESKAKPITKPTNTPGNLSATEKQFVKTFRAVLPQPAA